MRSATGAGTSGLGNLLPTLFAGETLSARAVLAAALIIGSVALVITVQQSKAKPVPVDVDCAPADD